MIARILSRIASRWLSSRKPDPRDAIRAKARQMCVKMGKPVPEVLK